MLVATAVAVTRSSSRSWNIARRVAECVVMSAFGRTGHWLWNLVADLYPEVTLGRRPFIAADRFLDTQEAIGVVRGFGWH
jgi:hypothetical protein